MSLLKNPWVNWRHLLLTLSVATTRWVQRFSTHRDAVFIVGDSLFDRNRSRSVDFLSKAPGPGLPKDLRPPGQLARYREYPRSLSSSRVRAAAGLAGVDGLATVPPK